MRCPDLTPVGTNLDHSGHDELRRTLEDGHVEILRRQASLKTHVEEAGDKINSIYNLLKEYEKNHEQVKGMVNPLSFGHSFFGHISIFGELIM